MDELLTPSTRPADDAESDAELVALVQSLPAGSTARERASETLISRYRPMVRASVRRYQAPPELTDELMQAGYLGLVKAITNFDPHVGASLPAYARPCINGEIMRWFRDHRWSIRIQRPLQELRQEIHGATAALTQELGRNPSAADLAQHLNVSEEQILEAQGASRAFRAMSLDAPVTDEDDAANLGELTGEDDPHLEHLVNIESVHAHWGELDDQAQLLLTLRFYGNMTQEQIGEKLGVSQMQVSRLLRRALDHLHDRLTSTPAEGLPVVEPAVVESAVVEPAVVEPPVAGTVFS
jgi:RNA polymerase sigma-B factor